MCGLSAKKSGCRGDVAVSGGATAESRGGAWGGAGPPLFLDQNEARRTEKIFFEAGPPLISGSG